MLTEDLYSAISNIANSIDALLDSHEQETSQLLPPEIFELLTCFH